MNRRRRRLATIAAILAVVAVACGVPIDEVATEFDDDELPESLRPTPPDPAGPVDVRGTGGPVLPESADVWLVRPAVLEGGRTVLEEVPRAVTDDGLTTALNELFEPVLEAEFESGLVSQLTGLEALSAIDVTLDGGLATLHLEGLPPLEGELLKQTFAQMVFTAVEVEGVLSVQFTIGPTEDLIEVPIDGGLTKRVVSRADYASLDPLVQVEPPNTTTAAPI